MAPRKKASKKVSFSEEDNQVLIIPANGSSEEPVSINTNNTENTENIENTDTNTTVNLAINAKKDSNYDTLTHVVVQLPISTEHVESLLSQDDMCNPLEYNPKLSEPCAYTPVNFFSSKNDEVTIDDNLLNTIADLGTEQKITSHDHNCGHGNDHDHDHNHEQDTLKEDAYITSHYNKALCFWCCHQVEHHQFGMPTRYDPIHNSFTFFGTFCSPECCSAYNFSIHMGSDRSWDVQSWIQIMARNYGIEGIIRPAPSRYTLQMFDGPLSIEEFRKIHKGMSRTIMVNIPPLVSMKPVIETINTSFFSVENTKEGGAEINKKAPLRRKLGSAEPKKTLEGKMNLSYTSLSSIIETNA
jgi:hypothetical protein